MKLKYYLRGLGIGILVTAAILTIVYHTKGSMSDSQIMKRAAQLGMVMASTEDDTLFAQTTQVDTTIGETGTISVEETTTVVETTEAVTEASTENRRRHQRRHLQNRRLQRQFLRSRRECILNRCQPNLCVSE